MNNKGFAITTIIYSMLILLSATILIILGITKSNYNLNKDYTNDIKSELNKCLEDGNC